MGILHEDLCTFMTLSHSVLLIMRNILDKSCRENQNILFYSITLFCTNWTICMMMWKYGRARQATDDNIIQRMPFACWVNKATDKCTEYVMLIDFPQRHCECTSVLCSNIHFFSCFCISFPLISSYNASLSVLFFLLVPFFLQSLPTKLCEVLM